MRYRSVVKKKICLVEVSGSEVTVTQEHSSAVRKASHDLEGLALFFLYEIAIFCSDASRTSHRQLGALLTSRPPARLLLYLRTNPTEFTEILKPKSKNAVFGLLARRMEQAAPQGYIISRRLSASFHVHCGLCICIWDPPPAPPPGAAGLESRALGETNRVWQHGHRKGWAAP